MPWSNALVLQLLEEPRGQEWLVDGEKGPLTSDRQGKEGWTLPCRWHGPTVRSRALVRCANSDRTLRPSLVVQVGISSSPSRNQPKGPAC